MATLPEPRRRSDWLVRFLTSDFCPGFNRYVYWLKEPIGWFVLATAVSGIVGQWFNPVGWTIAAALLATIAVGVAWPWFAVRAVVCELRPEREGVHEGEPCRMIFVVRNRAPIPVWGLAVEGYLDRIGSEVPPTVGLASVPPLCVADYPVTVTPSIRGRYPIQPPQAVCSFPFGIWTARRPLAAVRPLTVWPRVYPIAGSCPCVGTANADWGEGQRGGQSGDFVGVRPYRRGDSPKQIHWVQSARADRWIVTERGGPQTVDVELTLDVAGRGPERPGGGGSTGDRGSTGEWRSTWSDSEVRESLAWRVRVAASLIVTLRNEGVPLRVRLGDQLLRCGPGTRGNRQLLDALADIPHEGIRTSRRDRRRVEEKRPRVAGPAGGLRGGGETIRDETASAAGRASAVGGIGGRRPGHRSSGRSVEFLVAAAPDEPAAVVVIVNDPHGGKRAGGRSREIRVDCTRSPEQQLKDFWREWDDASRAA